MLATGSHTEVSDASSKVDSLCCLAAGGNFTLFAKSQVQVVQLIDFAEFSLLAIECSSVEIICKVCSGALDLVGKMLVLSSYSGLRSRLDGGNELLQQKNDDSVRFLLFAYMSRSVMAQHSLGTHEVLFQKSKRI